jgi:hypothetical protein
MVAVSNCRVPSGDSFPATRKVQPCLIANSEAYGLEPEERRLNCLHLVQQATPMWPPLGPQIYVISAISISKQTDIFTSSNRLPSPIPANRCETPPMSAAFISHFVNHGPVSGAGGEVVPVEWLHLSVRLPRMD